MAWKPIDVKKKFFEQVPFYKPPALYNHSLCLWIDQIGLKPSVKHCSPRIIYRYIIVSFNKDPLGSEGVGMNEVPSKSLVGKLDHLRNNVLTVLVRLRQNLDFLKLHPAIDWYITKGDSNKIKAHHKFWIHPRCSTPDWHKWHLHPRKKIKRDCAPNHMPDVTYYFTEK